jgi:hypothetical protein
MGWGLFILQDIQAEEPLFPFTSPYYTPSEYKNLSPYCPHLKHYALNGHDNFFINSDVEKGNVARYVNSSSNRCLEIENCIWKYNEVEPKPWDEKEWVWVMTISTKLIHEGKEFFCHYPINFLILTFHT